ncbi:MAG TPA: hypothetical protein VG893_04365 [Terracidiphilus sp.]|nr:hypothetical protein [Terracidiphilus sp.]
MDSTPTEQASPAAAPAAGPSPRLRVASRHLMNVGILMALPMLAAATLNSYHTLFVDPDIWWHLSDARILVTLHHFIWADPYSFTVGGHHWIDWEWLSELPFWFSYQALKLQGIYLVTWLLLCGNMLFLYFRGYRLSRSADAALWTSAIAFVLMTVNSGPRTIEFAYLAMSAELLILEEFDRGDKRFIWLMPPLFCLWINLHGFWFAGMVLFGMYIASGLLNVDLGAFQQKALDRAGRNRLIAVFAVSAVALLINPYGWHLMWQPVDMILNQKVSVSTIAEWQPIKLGTLEGRTVVFAIVLMIVTNLVRGRKWKLYELAFVLLGWYAAIAHIRFSYFAVVLTTPMLAGDLARAFRLDPDANTIPKMNLLMTAIAIGVMIVQFPSEKALEDRVNMMFPMKSIASIQPTWRTFDWDYVGGMMAFQHKPSFIDSRFDSFDQVGVMDEYGRIMAANDALELMKKYHVDHALVKDNQPIAYLLEHTAGWQVLMREKAWEGEYILFVKNSEPPPSANPCPPAGPIGK